MYQDELILSSSRGNAAQPNPETSSFLSLVRTEIHSPEILFYEEDLMDILKQQILGQQNSIYSMINTAQEQGQAEDSFTASLYQMDIERIRYTIARYLRTRVLKIERNLDFIINSEEMMERLSDAEKVFATKLYGARGAYIEDVLQRRFKDDNGESVNEEFENIVSTSDDLLKQTKPMLDTFVFCMSVVDDIYDSQGTPWAKGDVKIVLYSSIQEQVLSGQVHLL